MKNVVVTQELSERKVVEKKTILIVTPKYKKIVDESWKMMFRFQFVFSSRYKILKKDPKKPKYRQKVKTTITSIGEHKPPCLYVVLIKIILYFILCNDY